MPDYVRRRTRLHEWIDEDAFVTYNLEHSDPATIRYLTGFTGEGVLLVSPEETVLLTDSRYTEQAERETEGIRIEETRTWTGEGATEAIQRLGYARVAYAPKRVTCHWVETMRNGTSFDLVSRQDPTEALRRVKEEDEVLLLRRAAGIAEKALDQLLGEIRIGMSERTIALRLEWLIRQSEGAEQIAFETNVSSGPNTALNHYNPYRSPRSLQRGDLLLFDFGACVEGYRSDITRTFCVGTPSSQLRAIYDVVLRANLAAIENINARMSGVEADALARDLIAAEGHGEHFGHGLGHGIGLQVHEAPSLSPRSDAQLEPGIVVTIEPGVYLSGMGGVRIEDDVVLTEDGCHVLTSFPKDRFIEVG